jgi:hypothetical protein
MNGTAEVNGVLRAPALLTRDQGPGCLARCFLLAELALRGDDAAFAAFGLPM